MKMRPLEPQSLASAAETGTVRRRKGWLAGLLAAVCPGLGHLYAGRLLPALTLLWAPRFLFVLAVTFAVLADAAVVPVLLIGVALYLSVHVAQVVWAVVAARRTEPGNPLKRWNHVLVYVGFAVGSIIVNQSKSGAVKHFVAEAFKVPAASMVPSLLIGDHFLVAKLGARNRTPIRGDIVVFRVPALDANYVKRVVGLSGDEVSMTGGVLHVNGSPVTRKALGRRRFSDRANGRTWVPIELQVHEESLDGRQYMTAEGGQEMPDFGPFRVPPDSFFVLGDYRDNSKDSRSIGAVPNENLVGRACGLYFSIGESGFRLERVGLRL